MQQQTAIQLFEGLQIRVIWDDEQEKYFFSIVDVIRVLTDTPNAHNYWKVLKHRLKKEGNESVTNCSQLKMPSADGKQYLTDVQVTIPALLKTGKRRSCHWNRTKTKITTTNHPPLPHRY